MLTRKQHQLLTYIEKHLNSNGIPPSYDEMKIALDKHINPNADDSDSSAGTAKDFTQKVESEEDGVSEKIGAAFDKLLN